MSEHTTTQCLLFPKLFDRPAVARFDQRQGSSDGGAILLEAADRGLGLTAALAARRGGRNGNRAKCGTSWSSC